MQVKLFCPMQKKKIANKSLIVDSHLGSQHILVIVPVYNEGTRILRVVEAIRQAGFNNILVVDDGSTDQTREALQVIEVKYIRHPINRGQGAAIQTGFDIAKEEEADFVIIIDGDGQFNPTNITKVVQPLLKDEADLVIGSRFKQKNVIPVLRRLYNWIASILTYFLSGIYVGDSQSGFRALNKTALQQICLKSSGYEFCTEMIREASDSHLRITEVPVDVYYTSDSLKKGQSFATGLKTAGKLLIRTLTR